MAKANSFSPIDISAVKVLARYAAKRAVQNELRDQGVRVSVYPYADLMRLTHEYLANHPELYQQALERANRMTAEGVFGNKRRGVLALTINPSCPGGSMATATLSALVCRSIAGLGVVIVWRVF